jgi:pyruvate/2-oxoglutarate dehydrogenase complex dihydrolipoamide dehydrogenase (E3) component
MTQGHYDLVVIGAGSGGLVAARFAAQLGAKVALAEKNRIGGDCTWTGCVPSKALLRAARSAHEARSASQYGVAVTAPSVDMVRVRDYVRRAIQSVYQLETPQRLQEEGVDVILGSARFLDGFTLDIGERVVRSKKFLITTGARAVIPAVAGLPDVRFLTYENIFDNDALPKSMIVVGGGPVGVEMAQAYQRLGAEVTVVAERVLPKEDEDVQNAALGFLGAEGVRFVSERATSVRKDGAGVVIATERYEVRGDLLLVAAGRTPVVDGLGLESAGVRYSSRGIPVDSHLRTNVKHIYAAGDVLGGQQFTHYAGWQGFQAVRNALLPGSSSGISDLVPRVTFTDPEIAHAGATERQARLDLGNSVRIHCWPMNRVDRAVCENDLHGFIKIISKVDGTILGGTIVAARAGEAIVELVVAMNQKLKIQELAGAIHPYPTYSTVMQQVAAEIAMEQLLSGTSGILMRGLSRMVR